LNGSAVDGSAVNGSAAGVEAREFRRVLGLFATGVVAVTALDPATGRPVGLAANSFTAVSLSPPLVSVSVAHTSTTWPKIRAARGYCINILAEHQRSICLQLATPGAEKFRDVAWTASPAGHPILEGALGWLECGVDTEHQAGDHVIVISRVLRLDMAPEELPLIFYRGGYGRFETALV
jgi:3-hydroxy-9,10-secoandrosta-1,3,5(10)-triene-9,17-dione monooxygenase reductase component